jgi:hypothetical protein
MKWGFLLILLFGLLVVAGCSQQTEYCSEYEYWEETSEELPYPGLNCLKGPSKTVILSFFVYKDNEEYISNKDSILKGVELINTVYNPHGINFKLGEIIYINSEFPNLEETKNIAGETSIEYGSGVSLNSLGEEFKSKYNNKNLNIVLITDGWGAYSTYPWTNAEYHLTTVRASTLEISFIPAHELGHSLGLLHTHANSDNPSQDSFSQNNNLKPVGGEYNFPINGPPSWASEAEECYLTEDYICDNTYDCYTFCEEALGCTYTYQTSKPGQEKSEYEECGSEYKPPLDNLMSRYGDRQFLTKDQGARARFYLFYRLNNNLNGNTLQES